MCRPLVRGVQWTTTFVESPARERHDPAVALRRVGVARQRELEVVVEVVGLRTNSLLIGELPLFVSTSGSATVSPTVTGAERERRRRRRQAVAGDVLARAREIGERLAGVRVDRVDDAALDARAARSSTRTCTGFARRAAAA